MKKLALANGASSGIGKETARLLVEQGFTVYGASRGLEKMEDLKAMGVNLLTMGVVVDAGPCKETREHACYRRQARVLIHGSG
jgi:NADP-dependent 3-hydroxy acid dehydrogenase YdfG